ncbi:unnamed protein product, partial [Cylicostephanus goldi]
MPPISDKGALEAHILNQEIVRLDTMAKQKIDHIKENVRSEKALHEETREAKELLASLASKIDMLKAITSRLSSRREQQNVRESAERHGKELTENQHQLRSATIHARKSINESARSLLLEGGSEEAERRKRLMDEKSLKEDAVKTTERLSDLLSKMGEQVAQNESQSLVMEVDDAPVKMQDMVREYAELLRQSNDEDAKRMVTRVEGILEATDDS